MRSPRPGRTRLVTVSAPTCPKVRKWPVHNPPAEVIAAEIDLPGANVLVNADHSVASLTVGQGQLTIGGGNTLTVDESIEATNVALQASANLTTGGGSIESLTANGAATIGVTSDVLSVSSFSNSSPAVLTKQGDGTLAVAVTGLAAATTQIDLKGGTLRIESLTEIQTVQFDLQECHARRSRGHVRFLRAGMPSQVWGKRLRGLPESDFLKPAGLDSWGLDTGTMNTRSANAGE